ncbi:hypothetical protein MYCTH_53171 [Thermothelomyces thermophilus ATCC 42464]|uniref:Nucleoside 2-deoxyribosyltransferase-like protein n=1 Tax=Thermothelomyces thermophilus (strain ATCC 42464 / BCRC 31852 / DSM 1799) TaxID=573729 RepID=G2QGY7_THET4|nr:uncharacterized protein MYCTH_53171 [Thermothelomyces thermophilus ATCC 42464]AEO58647.1 hypothetical protein MYCTH_53171 [Thermothelomyces thermophilus ATCC 42464]
MDQRAQIIRAPSRPAITGKVAVFLAGTTTGTTAAAAAAGADWRETVTLAVSHLPVTVLNPLRPDWDGSWREDPSFAPFREQIEWELDMQERADLVVVYLGPGTDAPVSLLELGLCARSGKAVVVACYPGYRKRGNVQIVCRWFGLEYVDGEDDLAGRVVKRIERLLELGN